MQEVMKAKKVKEKSHTGGRLKRLSLLNPKNLEKEVHVYGYNFSWKAHLLLILCSMLGIGAVGILFKLKAVYFAVILIAVMVTIPVFVLNMYKRMYEQKRFSDVVTYSEQMLYAFQKTGKVINALKETREIFEAGRIREVIEQSIAYLEAGRAETEKGVLRESLEIIEKSYRCTKIQAVHELLISAEEYGGDTENSILLLLEDVEIWKRRGYKLQAEKKRSHTDNIISIIISVILCAAALYVLDSMQGLFPEVSVQTSIFKNGVIQISSLLFILAMVGVLMKSLKKLTVNWLKEEGLRREEYIKKSYHMVMNYSEGKEWKKSLLYAVPCLVAAIPVFIFGMGWLGIVCILLGAVLLFQHRIGYNLARNDVNRELYMSLPQWLMQLALLLQNNNVQVSIAKSVQGAPIVLREELQKLTERVQDAPDKLISYTDFCKDFDIPEAQSCMKMLHAMSESGTGNAKIQVNNLLHRVSEMQNMADRIKDESTAFKMRMIFLYPVGIATVKLLVDLLIGMVYMFQMLGNMGGM